MLSKLLSKHLFLWAPYLIAGCAWSATCWAEEVSLETSEETHLEVLTAPAVSAEMQPWTISPYVELGTNWIFFPYARVGVIYPIRDTSWLLDGAVLTSFAVDARLQVNYTHHSDLLIEGDVRAVSGAIGARKCYDSWTVGPEVVVGVLHWKAEDSALNTHGVYALAGARATYSFGTSRHWMLTLGGYLSSVWVPAGKLVGGPVVSAGIAFAL